MSTGKKIPQRQCIGCREMKDKKSMIRVIRTPEGEILLDETGKKNGRGCYVCTNQGCLEKAVRSHGIERSLKTAIPKEIYDTLMEEMKKIEEA